MINHSSKIFLKKLHFMINSYLYFGCYHNNMINDLGLPPKTAVVAITAASLVVVAAAGIRAKAENSLGRRWHWS